MTESRLISKRLRKIAERYSMLDVEREYPDTAAAIELARALLRLEKRAALHLLR